MTKLKSKKMTKSTFAVIIMAILMVAMLAFGGTYAYFTATTKEDSNTITLGYVKLKDNNAIYSIAVNNIMPGETILPAASFGADKAVDTDNTGIILTVDTTDKLGNYVAVRFDFKVTLDGGQTLEEKIAELTAQSEVTIEDSDPDKEAKEAAKAEATRLLGLYNALAANLTADKIVGEDCQTNVGSSASDDVTYQWNNFDGDNKNIYFLVSAEDGADEELQAVGATNLDEEDASYNDYEGKIELQVNAKAFTLLETIQDNWTEDETTSDLKIMKATIEITVRAASVQATAITAEDAQAELIELLK